MITKKKRDEAVRKSMQYLKKIKIVLTDSEKGSIEVADFGLGRLEEFGLQIITYINTNRVCAKELILFPGQICPEHKHPEVNGQPGKEETFRCRWGIVYLYIPGKEVKNPKANIPDDRKDYFTVWYEITLNPGEQYTLEADTLHWFQAGPGGAIISEFSTRSIDEKDVFTDFKVKRILELEE